MTIGPRDQDVPGVPFPGAQFAGGLRAGDADRERVIDALKTAFVQGRLTKGELDLHTGRALESRTYAELAAVHAAIPAWRPEALPRKKPAARPVRPSARKPVNKKLVAGSVVAIVLPPGIWAAFLTYYGGFVVMFMFALLGMALSAGPWPSGRRYTSANLRRK